MLRGRACIVLLSIGAVLGGGPGTVRAADTLKVKITGGADEVGHNYQWRVTNQSNSPIVRIEFPHYGADLFHAPPDWTQGTQKEMNLVNVGWEDEPGVCFATMPGPGLLPGATAEFGMRISSRGALKGEGTVRIQFADGTWAKIPGVELPVMPTRTSPYLGVVAMGAMLLVFIIVRESRRRKQPASTSAGSED